MTFHIEKIYAVDTNRYSTMKRRRRQFGQICLLLGGITLISTGLTIFIFCEQIYDHILKDALKFTPTSEAYRAWTKTNPPLDMDIYVFNWTNPQDIKNSSIKPKFQEVGPYRFKETKEKVNITWHDNNTISYRHKQEYFFDRNNSISNLSDVIMAINVVPLTLAYQTKDFGFWLKKSISLSLTTVSSLFVTKTVGEILFDGYEDNILSVLSKLPMVQVKDKFGIFYGKNGSVGLDGVFRMYTANDENFGRLLEWNHKNQTNFYSGHCNDIRGSAGEFFPLNRKRDKLVLYSSELCKYAELEYEKDVVIKGVRGYRYSADNIFDNGTKRPENACFCKSECIPSGVLDVSTCRDNSPTFLSLPHFYGADPYYMSQMEGMKPDRKKHEFYITIEPNSGITMEIGARMQVNMLLQPDKYISLYRNVPKVYVPIFYFTQTINLKDDLASSLRLLQNLPEYANYTSLILVSLGTILIIWGICSLFCCSVSKQKVTINGKNIENTHYEEVSLTEKPKM